MEHNADINMEWLPLCIDVKHLKELVEKDIFLIACYTQSNATRPTLRVRMSALNAPTETP